MGTFTDNWNEIISFSKKYWFLTIIIVLIILLFAVVTVGFIFLVIGIIMLFVKLKGKKKEIIGMKKDITEKETKLFHIKGELEASKTIAENLSQKLLQAKRDIDGNILNKLEYNNNLKNYKDTLNTIIYGEYYNILNMYFDNNKIFNFDNKKFNQNINNIISLLSRFKKYIPELLAGKEPTIRKEYNTSVKDFFNTIKSKLSNIEYIKFNITGLIFVDRPEFMIEFDKKRMEYTSIKRKEEEMNDKWRKYIESFNLEVQNNIDNYKKNMIYIIDNLSNDTKLYFDI